MTTMTGPYTRPADLTPLDNLREAVPGMLAAIKPAYGYLLREAAAEAERYYRLEAEGRAAEQTACGNRIDWLAKRIATLDAFRRMLLDI